MVKGPVEMKINQPQDLVGGAVLETPLSKEGGANSVTGWGGEEDSWWGDLADRKNQPQESIPGSPCGKPGGSL